LTLEPSALTLRQAPPDAKSLIVLERVAQALRTDLTTPSDPLRFAGRAALLRKERLRISLRAQCALLPAEFLGIFRNLTEDAN
jgi:hypothetical protein